MASTIEACFFPLEGVVFFPSTTLPLNIFEPRYIAMTEEILKRGLPLVLAERSPLDPEVQNSGSPLIAGMGTVQLFEQRNDGSRIILVRGISRVRVLSVLQEEPYIRCRVEIVADQGELATENIFFLKRLRQGLTDWSEQALPDSQSRHAFQDSLGDPARVVEMYAHYRLQDVDLRQQLLETGELNARVELLRRAV